MRDIELSRSGSRGFLERGIKFSHYLDLAKLMVEWGILAPSKNPKNMKQKSAVERKGNFGKRLLGDEVLFWFSDTNYALWIKKTILNKPSEFTKIFPGNTTIAPRFP